GDRRVGPSRGRQGTVPPVPATGWPDVPVLADRIPPGLSHLSRERRGHFQSLLLSVPGARGVGAVADRGAAGGTAQRTDSFARRVGCARGAGGSSMVKSLQANCPACGGTVEFKVSSSLVTICPYCRSVVARGDRKLEDLGKVADLVQTDSVLEVGR